MAILQKNRRAAAGVGLAAAAAAVLALGAGTYAAFTDTETAPDATFAAGTMNLEVGQSIEADPLQLANLRPGQTTSTVFTFSNSGTVSGTLSLAFAVTGADNKCTEGEADVGDACDGEGDLVDTLLVNVNGQPMGTLADLEATGIPVAGRLNAQAQNAYRVTVTLPEDAGNEVQSDSATIVTTATLKS